MLRNFPKKSHIEVVNFLDMKYELISNFSFPKSSLSAFSLPSAVTIIYHY